MKTNQLTLCSASAGSGKTYTLSAYYVGLLLSGVSHRSILAVTFTNKATNEMKKRILGFLYALKNGGEEKFLELSRTFMVARQSDTDSELRARAGELFEQLLEDFDDFHVMTIDTFLQSLLSGLAQMLDTNIGQNIELDIERAIEEAVDRMLTTELNNHEGLKPIVVDYLKEQMDNEASWDVRASMVKLIKDWYQESVQTLKGGICKDIQAIEDYKKNLDWKKAQEVTDLKKKAETFRTLYGNYEIGNTYTNILDQIERSCEGTEEKNIFVGLGKKRADFPNKTFQKAFKKGEQALQDATTLFLEIDDYCQKCREIYLNYTLGIKNLNNLKLLSFISSQLDSDMQDANRWLLAKTATTLSEALKPGDADFILEKAGIRYHHILIDEFQDTSKLQWANFLPLLQEVLSQEGGTALIVGDIKQSIYRWRNGDWHIMAGLEDEFGEDTVREFPLTKNYRSQSNVVRFNLETFRQLTQEDTFDYHDIAGTIYDEKYTVDSKIEDFSDKAGKNPQCGYVQMRYYASHYGSQSDKGQASRYYTSDKAKEELLHDMFADIAMLHNTHKVPYGDMLILVTKNTETDLIRKAFAKHSKELKISDCELNSSKIYQLDSSLSVMTVVSALHYVDNNEGISKAYLQYICKLKPEQLKQLKSLNKNMPLFELAQECIHICIGKNSDGSLAIKDTAYLNCLMDNIRDFVGSSGSDRRAFLNYWEDKMHESTIPPVGSNGIQIMTIHSAKGLESKNVFIPFCNWGQTKSPSSPKDMLWCESAYDTTGNGIGYIPIEENSKMKECTTEYNGKDSYQGHYDRNLNEERIDNLNVLYVALTRACDNLFIYGVGIENREEKDMGWLLRNIWKPTQNGLELTDYFKSEMEAVNKEYAAYLEKGQQKEGDSFEPITELDYYQKEMKPKTLYVEYTYGTPYIDLKEKENNEIFSFAGVKENISGAYFCNTEGIKFNQSQESLKYYEALEKAGDNEVKDSVSEANRQMGIICHEILSRIETTADKERVLKEAEAEGLITDNREKIKKLVEAALTCREEWFDGTWQLLRETAILWPEDTDADEETQKAHREKRPDRVMIKGNKAIVLDWKFAFPKEEHKEQVKEYVNDMKAMGYSDVEGYLWYGYLSKLDNVNE